MSHDFEKFVSFNEKVRSINRTPHILVIDGNNIYVKRLNKKNKIEIKNYDDIKSK